MDWVQSKIQQAHVDRWAQLDLGKADLTKIPPEVFDLEALEILVLGDGYYDFQCNQWVDSKNEGSSNRIAVIPRQITRLTNLRELFFSRNQVGDLTPLQGLANLTRLDLSNNSIGDEAILLERTLELSTESAVGHCLHEQVCGCAFLLPTLRRGGAETSSATTTGRTNSKG